jgi:hypothetical protein
MGAKDEAAAVAGRWASGRKGQGIRGLSGQSVATQIVPKFGPRLRPHGQTDENASGRYEHFFPSPVKIRPNRRTAVHLRRAIGDALTPYKAPCGGHNASHS